MKRTTIEVGGFGVNCSILEIDGGAWLVDPGQEPERLLQQVERCGLPPAGILLTHAHFDHIGAVPRLQAAYPELPVYVHPEDQKVITHPMNQLPPDYPPVGPFRNVRDCRTVPAALGVRVLETPGHTPGGVCYYFPAEKLLLSGDTLFAGSVGRTDLPGGNVTTLMRSLETLKVLPPDTQVIPGHGPATTIGDELRGNPFM